MSEHDIGAPSPMSLDYVYFVLFGNPPSRDSFSIQMLRLVQKADPRNRARMRRGFPEMVGAWEDWSAAEGGRGWEDRWRHALRGSDRWLRELQPLYLNHDEALILLEAVWLFERIHAGMLLPEVVELASLIIQVRDGPAGVARLDQLMARSDDRLPVLQSLHTALAELGTSLERTMPCPHCGSSDVDRGATGLDECQACGGLSRAGETLRP